jgi:DNA-binding beta-propeller fold protein YncE
MRYFDDIPIYRCRLAANLVMLTGVLACILVAQAQAVTGGYTTICRISPYQDSNHRSIISGIAFDNQPNPWVIDSSSWQMQRLDESNGATLQAYTPSPATMHNDSLAWLASNNSFYTANQNYLYRIDINNNTRTVIGPMQYFNFMELAFDPAGKLWLATDMYGGQLWSIDTATSALTLEHAITGLEVNQQVHALAIDNAGRFLVASSFEGDNRIYGLDPQTGATSLLTQWTDDSEAFINNMAVDPATGEWFGVRELRSEYPFGYYFVRLVGVPEPSTILLFSISVIGFFGWAWRWRR